MPWAERFINSNRSSGSSTCREATCRFGMISKCPLLYGYRFMMMNAVVPRWTMYRGASSPAATAAQNTHSESEGDFTDSMYCDRHGDQRRSINFLIDLFGGVQFGGFKNLRLDFLRHLLVFVEAA